MDIFGVNNTSVLSQGYVPFSNSGNIPENPALNSGAGLFDRLLEKAGEQTAGAEQSENTAPVLPGGKAVIDKTSQLFEACQEFETFLIKNLITGMRNTIMKSDLLDTGFAGEVYEDMLYDEYAKDFTKNAGFGFAEMAYLELSGQRGKSLANRPDFVAGK